MGKVDKSKAVKKSEVKAPPKEAKKPSIKQLLEALAAAEDPGDKRKLRSQLRAAGHAGGLRHRP